MNGLEKAYARKLDGDILAGTVLRYWFDSLNFRLAEKTFYKPDFLVQLMDLTLEIHEVKGGHWEDDARVKIKVAACEFPFRFRAIQRVKGEWVVEDFGSEEIT